MITEEVKKELKEAWGYEVVSESPLTLKGIETEEILVGLVAELLMKEVVESMVGDEDTELEFDDLDSMDDHDMLLVKGDFNYADEFDLAEWTTMTVGEFKDLVEKLKGHEDEIEWYFGTNEELQFDDGEDLLSQLSIEKITQEEADILNKLFDGSFDGGSGVFDRIWELGDDEDEDAEDDEETERSILDRNDLRDIEFLKGFGWEITVHSVDDFLLSFKSPQGEVSITSFGVLYDLKDYYRKNKN